MHQDFVFRRLGFWRYLCYLDTEWCKNLFRSISASELVWVYNVFSVPSQVCSIKYLCMWDPPKTHLGTLLKCLGPSSIHGPESYFDYILLIFVILSTPNNHHPWKFFFYYGSERVTFWMLTGRSHPLQI